MHEPAGAPHPNDVASDPERQRRLRDAAHRKRRRVDPRIVAANMLVLAEKLGSLDDSAMEAELDRARFPEKDRRFVIQLVRGALRHQARLDAAWTRYSHRPVYAVHPLVRAAMRIGSFQLLHLSRVPAYAAVDASVRLVKSKLGSGVGGFVNGVLRKVAEKGFTATLPERVDGPLAYCVQTLSFPAWLVERWRQRYGDECCMNLCETLNERAAPTLRVNVTKSPPAAVIAELAAENIAAAPGRYSPVALTTARLGPVLGSAAHASGLVTIQGEASQLVGLLARQGRGDSVLEMCAGVGGKSFHALERAHGELRLTTADMSPGRLTRMLGEAARLGLPLPARVAMDMREIPPSWARRFNCVLLDAPCSTFGAIRKHPDVKWRPEERLADVRRDQQSLVAAALEAVKPGGEVVYSVCSCESEEVEEILDFAVSGRAGSRRCRAVDLRERLPESCHAALLPRPSLLQTWPGALELDGMSAFVLEVTA
ncbi:MAG: hypothetical protein HYV63_34615 [Candidatus Schekmanbacteria bacterium]|nr:hypothetical protein [Candidatus Schekmanbacteria bacterium]